MRRKRYEDRYLDILDKSLSRASNVNRESVVREDVGASEGGGLYRASIPRARVECYGYETPRGVVDGL